MCCYEYIKCIFALSNGISWLTKGIFSLILDFDFIYLSMKSLRINVYGRVQGVWFRATTRELAEKLGLDGFVKNEPDGSVYIEVSGQDKAVMQFLNGVMEGPELAKVEKLVLIKDSHIHTGGFRIGD